MKKFTLLLVMLLGVLGAKATDYIAYQPTGPIAINYSGDQPKIEAYCFPVLADGDVITLRITNVGSGSGDNAPKYKLVKNDWSSNFVNETVITSTDGTISYTVASGMADEIKANGIIISGQNYSLLDVTVSTNESLSSTWNIVTVSNGNTSCGSSGTQINITDRSYIDVVEGDVLTIEYSSASDGQIFLQYNWSGQHHDHGGLSGSGTIEITIDNDLLNALKNSAQVYGKNVTVGNIYVKRSVNYVSDVINSITGPVYDNYYANNQINITDGNDWSKVETGDYFEITYTIKNGEEGELYIRNDWGGDYYHHSHLIGTNATMYIAIDETLKGFFSTIQLWCTKITLKSIKVVRNINITPLLTTPGYRPVYIPASGYATFFADNTCALPDGVEAYYAAADNVSSDKVVLTQIDNIPANNGVILNGSEGIYQIYTTTAAPASVNNNKLVGATTRTDITSELAASAYMLYNNGGTPEFRKMTEGTKLDAYKCYLNTAGTAGAGARLNIVFDDSETTGINAATMNKVPQDNAYYTLSGQRVDKPIKGLYIVNGKKVIIK